MRTHHALIFAGACAGCSALATTREPAREPAPASLAMRATSDTTDVRVELRGATRVRYVPSQIGPTKSFVRIVVVNRSGSALDVSNLRMRLDATRDGVVFPCAREAGLVIPAREPSHVPPGGSASFDRELDCSLPLSGKYVVRVVVAFGREGPWAVGRAVRTLSLNVVAPPSSAPRQVESVPGLWGAVGVSSLLPGTVREANGRLVLALVNGSSKDVTVPPLRLALRVFRTGLDIPCEDEPIAITAPPSLPPGGSHVQKLEISCLGLGRPGNYEIAGRLLVAGDDRENELGRIRVEITSDPARVVIPR